MGTETGPAILWVRRELRLADHPALVAAAETGAVIPVVLRDGAVDTLGAAASWRLEAGLAAFAAALEARGSRLVLRTGEAARVLPDLARETGARSVHWSRPYDPQGRESVRGLTEALDAACIAGHAHAGTLLFEPDTVATKQGGAYKVFTPYRRAVRQRGVAAPLRAPERLPAPEQWPVSEALAAWRLGAAMNRGAAVLAGWARPGEAAAQARLAAFVEGPLDTYAERRDLPAVAGTSDLSEHLTLGEISPRQCWHAALRAREEGRQGADAFLRELVWRDFAYHLLWHTPRLDRENWRSDWDRFPWNTDADRPDVVAWTQGRTGIPFVDAGLREMQVTGRMHNRARLVVASYLTKHLLTDWRIGAAWFADQLIDWDPANNALNWQWAAGSGPDASPFFRIFNPETQLDRFDRGRDYVHRWIAEGQDDPPETALAFFDAVPRRWELRPDAPYPDPVVTPAEGRARALAAYQDFRP